MRIARFSVAFLATLACVGGLASAAQADVASINVQQVQNNNLLVNYVVGASFCRSSIFCGWFSYGVQVPASQTCRPHVQGSADSVWVGPIQQGLGTQTGSTTFVAQSDPVRVCAYVSRGSDYPDSFAGETVFALPPPPPPPLGVAEAKAEAKRALRARFGTGKIRRLECSVSANQGTCGFLFLRRNAAYSGIIDVTKDNAGVTAKVRTIRRRRG
jgi:hypothetical protein